MNAATNVTLGFNSIMRGSRLVWRVNSQFPGLAEDQELGDFISEFRVGQKYLELLRY